MNKLEELGGLEAAKSFFEHLASQNCMTIADDFAAALISQVESLTAERDRLDKMIRSQGGHVCNHDTCENLIGPRDYAICTSCFQSSQKRIEELERELQSSQINYDKYDDLISIQKAKLQRYRELAEMVAAFVPYAPGTTLRVFDYDRLKLLKAKARELLKADKWEGEE